MKVSKKVSKSFTKFQQVSQSFKKNYHTKNTDFFFNNFNVKYFKHKFSISYS